MRAIRRAVWLAAVSACSIGAAGCGGGSGSGAGSDSGSSSNPTPVLSSINPPSAVAGSVSVTLSANGSGFVSGSTIDWNGSALPSTFVSASQLSATLPASDLATAGTAKVTVASPAPGGGTSAPITFTINPVANPTPAVTSLSPSQYSAGGPAFTLTVTGTGFLSSSQVLWNGTARSATFNSATSLTTQITASDVATPGAAAVAVSNPSPGGGSSNAVNFVITSASSNVSSNLTVLDIEGNDLAWSPQQQKLFVSIPAAADSLSNTITVVDPVVGQILTSVTASSEPSRLAISDDGQFLYTALVQENAVARFTLPAVKPDIKFALGTDPDDSTHPPLQPLDLRVQPGAAHTVAVLSATNVVSVFDDATARPSAYENIGNLVKCIEWKADGSALFGQDSLSTARSFYTFTVNSNGVTLSNQYGAAFRRYGVHLHVDAQTNYVYSDSGEVVNSATGLPVGHYQYSPVVTTLTSGPVLTQIDPVQGRVFMLSSYFDQYSNLQWAIRSFDQKDFHLLGTILIPGVVGVPADFIRWGQSGLAFVTNNIGLGGTTAVGKLYILDGVFVNPSGPADGSSGSPLNSLPTLTALSSASAPAGSSDVALTLSGRDFSSEALVQWNATTIPSTWISPTQIQATVPALYLGLPNQANITVVNPTPGGGISPSLAFTAVAPPSPGNQVRVYGVGGNDVVWDSTRQKLYVSSSALQGDLANKIVAVDPVAGTISPSAFIGSDPAGLSISSDGQYLYAGMNGQVSVERLLLPALTLDISFILGSDSFDGPFFAQSFKAAPGSPHTVAVSKATFNFSPSSAGITIFDDATPRAVSLPGWPYNAYGSVEWGSDASTLYASAQVTGTELYSLSVDGNGVSTNKVFSGALIFPIFETDLLFDKGTGLLYTEGGQVVRPSDATVLGTFGASGLVATDASLNRVFILGQTPVQSGDFSDFTIESFNQTSFAPIDTITISHVVGDPVAFVRWGTNGLAFVTRIGAATDLNNIGPGQLYVISGSFVNSSEPENSATKSKPIANVRMTRKR
jgi:trimeric autotransporter adhesin